MSPTFSKKIHHFRDLSYVLSERKLHPEVAASKVAQDIPATIAEFKQRSSRSSDHGPDSLAKWQL